MGSWKMRRAQFPVALLLLCVLSCAAEQNPFKYDARVSIIALIAAPAQYSGRHVRTEGYASIVDGNSALFLTSEHARERSLLNGVALVFVESEISEADLGRLSEKRIIVDGVFHGPADGYDLRGSITDITRIIPLEAAPPP